MDYVDYVNWLRRLELERVMPLLPAGARILEVGAGSGQQALDLSRAGYEVEAIDIPSSNYVNDRIFPVIDYDGRTLPFPDASFDVVFSSNVLEHIRDLGAFHSEAKRVLKPGGTCIHVMPTGGWQFWTIAAAFPKAARTLGSARNALQLKAGLRAFARAFLPVRHGERGNALLELWLFRPRWWRHHFRAHGFELLSDQPMGMFYTAQACYGPSWSIERRRSLAPVLGSATHLFQVRPADPRTRGGSAYRPGDISKRVRDVH